MELVDYNIKFMHIKSKHNILADERGCFSFCLVIMLSVGFLNNRTNFC